MDGKIWGYGAGFAHPIPPISFLFRRFPESLFCIIIHYGYIRLSINWGCAGAVPGRQPDRYSFVYDISRIEDVILNSLTVVLQDKDGILKNVSPPSGEINFALHLSLKQGSATPKEDNMNTFVKNSPIKMLIAFAVLAIGLACMCNGLSFLPQTPTQAPIQPTQAPIPLTATPPPSTGSISSTSSGSWLLIATDSGLWRTDPDGSNPTRIWQGDFWQADLSSAIQPGGNQVVLLTSDPDRYHHLALNLLLLPEGQIQKITDLTTSQTEPGTGASPGETSIEAVRAIADNISFAWSPDGTKLAFIGVLDGPTSEVYLYDTTTNNIKRVSYDDAQDFWPSWSPDGKRILFFGAESFGTGAGYAMKGVWSANGDGSNVSWLYETSGSGEELVGWRDNQAAVLDSWNPICGSGNLRLYEIVTTGETILQADCFNTAAAGEWNGVTPSPVMFSTGDGLYFLAGNSDQVQKVSDKPANLVHWDEPGYMFVVKFDDGSLSTFYSGETLDHYDAPFIASGNVDVTMYGLIWAWTVSGGELEGVWITGPGMEVGQVFGSPAFAPLWDLDNNLLFFSKGELGTDLYRATFSAYYQDVTFVNHFDETILGAAWVGIR